MTTTTHAETMQDVAEAMIVNVKPLSFGKLLHDAAFFYRAGCYRQARDTAMLAVSWAPTTTQREAAYGVWLAAYGRID